MVSNSEYECMNITGHELIPKSHQKLGHWIYTYMFPILALFIIFANLLVVISSGLILKKGQKPKTTYLFLGNVAMADLFTGLAIFFGRLFPPEHVGHYYCATIMGMIICGALTSVYSIGLIGYDRFLYIIFGLRYKIIMYPRKARFFISITWIIGLTLGFLPLMGWHGGTNNGRCCWFVILVPKWLFLMIFLAAAVPLTVVFFLYSIILYKSLKKIIQIQQTVKNTNTCDNEDISAGKIRMFVGRSQNDLQTTEQQSKQGETKGILQVLKKKPPIAGKWKAIKVVMFTTGGFVITLTPFFIVGVARAFTCDIGDDSGICKTLTFLTTNVFSAFGMLNPILNPVIYAWWHKGFRRFVKKKAYSIIRRRNF